MAEVVKRIGKGAVRNLLVKPAIGVLGGPGSTLQLLHDIIQPDLPESHQPKNVFPTIQSLTKRYLENVPEGYEGTAVPQGKGEEALDFLLQGINPFNIPKSAGQIANLARSNIAGETGRYVAEKLGLGSLGQLAGGAIGRQVGQSKGHVSRLAPEAQREAYASAKEAGKGNPVKSNIVNNLKEKIQDRVKDLDKGLLLKEKPKLRKQADEILATLNKHNVDIEDIVKTTQDLNTLAYDPKLSKIEQGFYRTLIPHTKQAIKEYGKEFKKHGYNYQQGVDLTKFIKNDSQAIGIVEDLVNKGGRLSGFKNATKTIVNAVVGEGSIKDLVRFAHTGPKARQALIDLNIGLLSHDKALVNQGLNLINRINMTAPEAKKTKKNSVDELLKNAKNVEFLD